MFLHVGRVQGFGDGKRESLGRSSCSEAEAWWAAQPPSPAGTLQRGDGLQLEEVGSWEYVKPTCSRAVMLPLCCFSKKSEMRHLAGLFQTLGGDMFGSGSKPKIQADFTVGDCW